ncbi:methyltransferase [Pseudomonas aeruginosa]|nr:methyltransferase [Pseudomonas aeruginosa]
MLIRSILPSAARGFEHARALADKQFSAEELTRTLLGRWHVKGEECERTHSRTRHRQR